MSTPSHDSLPARLPAPLRWLPRFAGNVALATGLLAGPLIVITGALADYFL